MTHVLSGRAHQPVPADHRAGFTPLEWHSGLLVGQSTAPTSWRDVMAAAPAVVGPRAALENVVRAALGSDRPTAVQFSGGRDSSLVLAIAVHVARREGLPLPRVVCARYPGVADADESQWQDLITDHLGVELEVVTVPTDGDDLAGPLAVDVLRRTGPFLPPTAGVVAGRLAGVLRGHVVLTGEGGDNILGQQRITWWSAHRQARRWPGPYARRAMAFEMLPRPERRRRVRARLEDDLPLSWLRPEARAEVLDRVALDETAEPWDWRTATWAFLDSRMGRAIDELDRIGAFLDVHLAHPLLAPDFVAALCHDAGRWGYVGRTEAMRMLAGDLLPEALIARSTKAYFNGAYSGRWTRTFARTWDGAGIDPAIADADLLRSAWLSDVVPPASTAPLQLALTAAVDAGWSPVAPDAP